MLYIKLLGPPSVERDGATLAPFKSRKALALLAFLALSPGARARSELAGLLWSDTSEKQALDHLRYVLWELRRALGPEFLRADRLSVCLNEASAMTIDAEIFRRAVENAAYKMHPSAEDVAAWERALDLYRGDFLAGLGLDEDILFCEWLERQRALHREWAVNALHRLSAWYTAQRRLSQALQATRRLLDLDPWREEAHRQMMVLLARDGQRTAALAQYETCRRVLAAELGIEPSPRTHAWYERIRAGNTAAVHNLPPTLNSFIGREEERAHIASLLQDPTCRLISLIGPGGIGKTRLALQIAAEHVDEFLHGAFCVPLAGLDSADLIVPTIAEHLRFPSLGTGDLKVQLLNYLRGKEMLLILDDFEHRFDGAALLIEILRHAPEVKIIVTARERLDLQAETIVDVQGMGDEAVALFLDRARRVRANVADNAGIESIERICRLVDGLPLGIELAAAAARDFSCAEIAQHIAQNLDFLTTAQGDVPAKHRSLRAVFDYAWKLLSVEEQESFRYLSVLRGRWTPLAAESVAGAPLRVVAALAAKSLLRRSASNRFEMGEVLRQYASEKLSQPERVRARDSHARWFAEFLAAREESLKGGKQKTALEEIAQEIENIRPAWQWMVQQNQSAGLAHCLNSLFLFYETRNWFQEGERMMALAVEQLSRTEPGSLLVGRLLARRGVFVYRLSRYANAKEALLASLTILRAHGDRTEIAFALNNLGNALDRLGDYESAQSHWRESLAISREIGDRWGTARTLNNLGYLLHLKGSNQEARAMLDEVLVLRRALGDHSGVARTLINLGLVASEMREFAEATRAYEQALEIFRELDNPLGTAICLNNLGYVAHRQNDYPRARALYLEALALRRTLGDQWGIALAHDNLGVIECLMGNYAQARQHFQHGLRIASEIRGVRRLVEILVGVAGLEMKLGNLPRAAELLGLALGHSALSQESAAVANEHVAEIAKQVAPADLEACLARGKAMALDGVVGEILNSAE